MTDEVQQVVVSPDVYMMQIRKLQNELKKTKAAAHDLEVQLGYERSLREKPPEEEKKKAPKKHGDAPYTDTYSDFKSDGVRKPHAADSIRSYDDFKAIQDYFLAKNDVRDWALWTVGVSLGLRVSDLFSLRFGHMIDRARIAVSDFVLGRSGVNVLIAGDRYTVDDVMDRLDVLEDHLTSEKEDQ